jgi:hypothetical protein
VIFWGLLLDGEMSFRFASLSGVWAQLSGEDFGKVEVTILPRLPQGSPRNCVPVSVLSDSDALGRQNEALSRRDCEKEASYQRKLGANIVL